MGTYQTARTHLKRSVSLAKTLEACIANVSHPKKSTVVGFGILIQQRRLSQSILLLGRNHAFESRILFRSMMECHFNYKWILLFHKEYRANRFLRFHPLEQYRVHESLSGFLDPVDYHAKEKELKSRLREVRHLFRKKKRKGKLIWDSTWASVTSFKDRLMEVLKYESNKNDEFLYGLYRLTSSTVHVSPISVFQTIEKNLPLRAKMQPESETENQIKGAFLILMDSIRTLAEETSMIEDLEPELSRLERIATTRLTKQVSAGRVR